MGDVTIGDRIRDRREALRLSVDDVASLASLPVERLDSIETGASMDVVELEAIAGALASSVSQLAGETELDSRRLPVRFLSLQDGLRLGAIDARLLARLEDVGRIGRFLWDLLGRAPPRVSTLRRVCGIDPNSEPWRQGYELGANAREAVAPGGSRLESVQALIERLGVHVAEIPLEAGIAAASLIEADALPVIVMNRSAGTPRVQLPLGRRTVLGHELCHVLHDGTRADLATIATPAKDVGTPIEQRANGFAPSFIAPRPWLDNPAGGAKQVVRQLAESWGLSWEGACWHAKNCELIDPTQAEVLRQEKEDVLADVELPIGRTPPSHFGIEVVVSPLVSGLVAELTLAAVSYELISRGRAREILTLR